MCGHYNGQIVINVPAHTPHWSRGPSMVPVAVFRALIMMGGGYNRTLGPEGGAAQCSQVKHTRGGALLLTAALICCACALQTSDATEPGNILQRLYLVTCMMTFVRCNTIVTHILSSFFKQYALVFAVIIQ